MKRLVIAIILGLALVPACSGDDDDGGPAAQCADVSGTWGVTGDCGAELCVMTQSGCSTNFDCSGGTASYTGSVSGNTVTYSGGTPGGVTGTCTATVDGDTMTGTCDLDNGLPNCNFTATRQ